MKRTFFLFFIVLFQVAFAQRFSHPLRAGGTIAGRSIAVTDTLHILGILVQFQNDDDTRTTGTGQFDLSDSTLHIIDPPPHDSAYFSDHIQFARNYFTKASNGKFHIVSTILGKVLTLPKTMEHYVPDDTNTPLATLLSEAWAEADSAYPGFPFDKYDLFVVFHAGVGKDVDLRATLGYDPAPFDLPSLYFNLSSLQQSLGSGFQGFPVSGSSFLIRNSVLLPETEVRTIPSVVSDFTLTLGMNGVLVASIGSHLGLPDLFDTENGKTAIGRFGLMDGQSIFTFLGICPPEPSAWEKAYLGWTTPIEVYGNKTLTVPAASLYDTGIDTVYKIPISSKEYFLVENRERDAKHNGQTVTMLWKGDTLRKTFTADEDNFNYFNIDTIYGTVIDVDELDWGIPGLINAENDYPGGIVIWHIDESIIDSHIASNSINADPEHRGVDVEEADGSQDLGQSYDLINPGSGSEDGSPLDYWFQGNSAPVYTNEFSPTSHPNSLSNSFAQSHITLKDFSTPSSRMTFSAAVGDGSVQLVKIIKRTRLWQDNNDTPLLFDIYNDGKDEFIYTEASDAYLLDENLRPFFTDSTGLIRGSFRYIPTIARYVEGVPNNAELAVSYKNYMALTGLDSTNPGVNSYGLDTTVTTPVYSIDWGTNHTTIVAGTKSGLLGIAGSQTLVSPERLHVFSDSIVSVALTVDGWVATDGDSLKNNLGASASFEGKKALEIVNARITPGGSVSTVVRFMDNSIAIYDEASLQRTGGFSVPYSGLSTMAIADINRDGLLDILVGTGPSLSAFNSNGSMIDHFPLPSSDGGNITGCPVVIGIKNSNSVAIVFGSTKGQIDAVDETGKMLPGFPLQTGGMASSPAVNGEYLVAASLDSSVYFWKIPDLFDASRLYWNGYLADRGHSNFVENKGVVSAKSTELLPKSLAYNWPNPVYSGTTHIRYFLGKTADVTIKILNMAGELVQELKGTGYAGLDNEVQWDVSNIQSGVYFAEITANGNSGSQSQIVKIAVVK